MVELFNKIKLYFYCSSKQGKGYVFTCVNNSEINIENKETPFDFNSKEVNCYMRQQGVGLFYLYDNSNYYIGIKKIPHPDGHFFRDRSESDIFINVLFQSEDDSIIRLICTYVLYKFDEFKELIYSAYNCDDYNNEKWGKIGYSFDLDKIKLLLDNAFEIKNNINYGNFPVDKKEQKDEMKLLNKKEAIGWVLSGVHNSHGSSELYLASIIDIDYYKENYKLCPYYYLENEWYKSSNKRNYDLELLVEKFIDSRPQKKNLILIITKVLFLIFCLSLIHPQVIGKITETIVLMTEKANDNEQVIQTLETLNKKQIEKIKNLEKLLEHSEKTNQKSTESSTILKKDDDNSKENVIEIDNDKNKVNIEPYKTNE